MTSRRILALFLTAVMIAAACSSSSDQTAEPAESPTDETTDEPAAEEVAAEEVAAETPEHLYNATIRRTTNNVPHITAADNGSLGFGYGYALAEDHLCTLADVIVSVRSERSSFHGPGPNDKYLNSDVVYQGIDLYKNAGIQLDNADPDLQAAVRGYAAGYNSYLDSVGADGVTGWCQGEEWVRPIDEYDLAAHFKALTLRASIDPMMGFIASATPPEVSSDDEQALGAADFSSAVDTLVPDPETFGSNAWAVGPDRTADGTTMLVGNPHFPWQGSLRFYEVHLTIPGTVDVYGASLLGSPVVNIGFNNDVAWSHTVSAGNRFTAYTVDLVEGDPTSYHYGDEEREMTAKTFTLDVLSEDGTIESVERTVWSTHYGPVLDFPGVGWSERQTITIRDANAENDEIIPQFWDMNRATSMDELIAAHADNSGIPWVNTLAASADGRIWYADTSSTPNLSDEAIAAWQGRVETDFFTGIAYDSGVVLLDGSDPLYEWVNNPEARDPGVVAFADMPQLERSDVLFNANDSYRWANPDELTPIVSPLHGRLSTPGSRTRMSALLLSEEFGGAGEDGLFTQEELRDTALSNRVLTGEWLRDDVVARCTATPEIMVDDAPFDLTKACEVLADWDLKVDIESRGAVLWREFMGEFDFEDLKDQGELWANPHVAEDLLNTPSGLAPASEDGDAVLVNLAAAVSIIEGAGFPIDVALGTVQFAYRGDIEIPIHGGLGPEGVANVVGSGSNGTTTEPNSPSGDAIGGSARLRTDGYPVANGTSFIYTLEFTADGPVADAFLTYGNTGDSESEYFSDQTQRFSDKDWRRVAFTEDAIAAETLATYEVAGD
ncbi:MAG: penicillin acylase family protein [Acidimicrobiales bacterium]